MIDITKLVEAIAAEPLPRTPFIAALPMYDWPEVRGETDALWVKIRDALQARGIAAPEHLTRRNGDMPDVNLPPDEFDLPALWRHPNLLVAMTCWGPMELGLRDHVRVVGQSDYAGVAGCEGEYYRSAIVMRRRRSPPSDTCGDISPQEGRLALNLHPWGEMSASPTEGGSLSALLSGLRLAYNSPDSMSGYLAIKRDLEAQGADLAIFSSLIQTHGHRNSLRAVANGEADVTCIDAKSWELAQQFEPAARELDLVAWTEKRLGLPWITNMS